MKMMQSMFLAMIVSLTSAASSAKQAEARSNKTAKAGISERKQYQEKTEAKLRELDKEIAKLKVKVAKQDSEAGKQIEQQMADLEQKREAAGQQLQKFKKSSQDAWQDMKEGINAAINDLQAAYSRAASHFK
jgi:TolA-binding protein